MHDTASYTAYKNSPYRSVKHSTYFETYDRLFDRYRGKPITFVEIGVLKGGSLFMWREFFGPQARIIGVELNPAARKWEDEGFEIHIGSQSDPEFLAKLKKDIGSIDVLLDDGGHTYEQQIVTTEELIDSISDGGMLVVEDTHTSYMDRFGPPSRSFMNYVYNRADRINCRFAKLDGPAENRIWSIEIFESIVAFHVNRQASRRVSEETDNGGADDGAPDFRMLDQQKRGRLARLMEKLPGIRSIYRAASTRLQRQSGAKRLDRYFR